MVKRAVVRLLMVAAVAGVFLPASSVQAQTCTLPAWGAGPPLAGDIYGAAVTTSGGFVYAAGGYSFSSAGTVFAFQRYDPVTNTWTNLAPLMAANTLGSLVDDPVGNRLFLFGGSPDAVSATANVQVYDIAGNTWSAGPVMPGPRELMGSGRIGNFLYLVAGYSTGQVTDSQNQNWQFDPVTGTYTPKAVLPAMLGGAGSAVAGGKLYVMGGRDPVTTQLNSNFAYDPGSDSWATLAVVPTAINVPAAAALSGSGCTGEVLLAGGGNPFLTEATAPRHRGDAPQTTGITQMYDPGSNSWTAGPALPQGRSFAGAAQAGDTLIVLGGYNGSTTVATVDRIQGPPLPVGLSGFSIE